MQLKEQNQIRFIRSKFRNGRSRRLYRTADYDTAYSFANQFCGTVTMDLNEYLIVI